MCDGGRFSPAVPGTAVLGFGVLGVVAVVGFAALRLGVPVRRMRGRRRRRRGR
jgi:hypothetical protein